jgi:hypothetical protein
VENCSAEEAEADPIVAGSAATRSLMANSTSPFEVSMESWYMDMIGKKAMPAQENKTKIIIKTAETETI